jgi:hypothetical protein
VSGRRLDRRRSQDDADLLHFTEEASLCKIARSFRNRRGRFEDGGPRNVVAAGPAPTTSGLLVGPRVPLVLLPSLSVKKST